MPSLKSMFEAAERGDELVVTPEHTAWLEMPEDEQNYSDQAVQFAMDVLLKKFKHARSGRFSPSSMGMCNRRLMFGYQGAPQVGFDLDTHDLMANGHRFHIFWQMEGMTRGWLLDGEVWCWDELMQVGGSIDGVLVDDSIFEYKSTRESVYNKVIRDGQPKWEHMLQFGTYALITGRQWGSIVYEDRASGQFTEFRVKLDGQIQEGVLEIIEILGKHLREGTMPPILNDCEMRTGRVYKDCPYRKHCLSQPDAPTPLVLPRIQPRQIEGK